MIASIKDSLFAPSTLVVAIVLLSGCASTDRSDRRSDCAKARARYAKMRRSVDSYYAAGTTSSAQIAIAERRLSRAKNDYESACGGRASRRGN